MVVNLLKQWDQRYWWLRGVTAAFAVLGLVPNFVDLDRFEILRAFHAIVVGWNNIAAFFGRLLGQLPYVPDLGSDFVNVFLLGLTCLLPGFTALSIILSSPQSETLPWYFWPVHVSTPLIKEGIMRVARTRHPLLRSAIIVTLSLGLAIVVGNPVQSLLMGEAYFDSADADMMLFVYAILLSFLGVSIAYLPSFRRGVVVSLGFVATLEVLYLSNLPVVSEWINERACAALDTPPDQC